MSETARRQPDPAAMRWLAANDGATWLPTIVLAELRYGIEKLPASRQRTALDEWMAIQLERYHDRLLAFDARAADAHGRLRARLKAIGKPMDAPDSYIAAIALAHGATVATRNSAHFLHAGVPLVDPWAC